jgi:hypothetical protein
MKAFVRHSRLLAEAIGKAVRDLSADFRVALTHYSPVAETLAGEPLEIYPFLGSYFLAEAADSANADLCIHGHAHAGSERGTTPGGAPVRNVALPVLERAYALYCLGEPGSMRAEPQKAGQAGARLPRRTGKTHHGSFGKKLSRTARYSPAAGSGPPPVSPVPGGGVHARRHGCRDRDSSGIWPPARTISTWRGESLCRVR